MSLCCSCVCLMISWMSSSCCVVNPSFVSAFFVFAFDFFTLKNKQFQLKKENKINHHKTKHLWIRRFRRLVNTFAAASNSSWRCLIRSIVVGDISGVGVHRKRRAPADDDCSATDAAAGRRRTGAATNGVYREGRIAF